MVAIETIATVMEDGTMTARAPGAVSRGRHRAFIVLEEASLERDAMGNDSRRGFPDMSLFRQALGVPAYSGNSVLEMREEERD